MAQMKGIYETNEFLRKVVDLTDEKAKETVRANKAALEVLDRITDRTATNRHRAYAQMITQVTDKMIKEELMGIFEEISKENKVYFSQSPDYIDLEEETNKAINHLRNIQEESYKLEDATAVPAGAAPNVKDSDIAELKKEHADMYNSIRELYMEIQTVKNNTISGNVDPDTEEKVEEVFDRLHKMVELILETSLAINTSDKAQFDNLRGRATKLRATDVSMGTTVDHDTAQSVAKRTRRTSGL